MAIIKTTVSDKLDFDAAITELREYFSSLGARKGRQLTYNVLTYGCQLNESDSEKLSGMLASMGLTASSGGELDDADVIVFNTCSIRENADRHLFGNLGVFKTLKKNDHDVVIAVGGCMMKVPENVERIKKSYPYVDLVFDPQQLHRFPVLMRDAIRKDKQLVNISADDYIAEDNFFPIDRKRKFRALVPIMYGCNNFCTYCIVPYARGRERSRDFNEIVKELSELASQGYKEVMLLGQNVNSYKGAGGETFADILRAASDFKEFSRVRFMSSHPKDLSDEVIDIMATRPNVEKHLRSVAVKNQAVSSKPQITDRILRPGSEKSHPEVNPWVLFIRLVERLHLGIDQKPVPRSQLKGLLVDHERTFPFQDDMNQVYTSDSRSVAMSRHAVFISDVAQLEFRKPARFRIKQNKVFHRL